ncbi:hypothetical protein BH18ACI4_BH18ACI4_14290 [soil metagenome]
MVDEEVEKTLREIRDRVRKTAGWEADAPGAVISNAANVSITPRSESATRTPETLARIDAYLTTTARAWDRLPPLVSNRSGGLARLELWVKRRFKQATRWYSWEQVNFNAAVHHALRDTLDALLDLERRAQMSAQQSQIEKTALRTEFESQRAQIEAEQRARSLEMSARLADLTRELRERDQQRLEEQRVCFKQLSLEMSEAEVLLDRTRRDIESRLAKLESSKR